MCVSVHSCIFLQVSLHPVRCYSGARGSLHHSFISPFLTQALLLCTPSMLLLGSVSANLINYFVCTDVMFVIFIQLVVLLESIDQTS